MAQVAPPALFDEISAGAPLTRPGKQARSSIKRIRELNGRVNVTVVRAPRTSAEAEAVKALLLRNYGELVHPFFRREVPPTVGDGSKWRNGQVQVWMLVRETDDAPLATLLWRFHNASKAKTRLAFGEALFSTTMENHRRAGYGTELAQAWISFMKTEGAEGVAVSSIGYGADSDDREAAHGYGFIFWSSLGLTLCNSSCEHYGALKASMLQFCDTKVHALFL